MTVNHGEEKIIALLQIGLNAADDKRPVCVPDFFGYHADGVGPLLAQGAREKIRTILQFASGSVNPSFRNFGNGTGGGGVVQDSRHSAGSEADPLLDEESAAESERIVEPVDARKDVERTVGLGNCSPALISDEMQPGCR